MPGKHVSLLRGINVGGHNLIPMGALRTIYESIGCEDVATYLQTGNVVFRTARTQARVSSEIEAEVAAEFGFTIRVLDRSHAEMKRIVAADPFPDAEPARRLALFLEPPLTAPLARELARVTSGRDEAVLIGQEFHVHCPDGIGNTKLLGVLSDRRLGVVAT